MGPWRWLYVLLNVKLHMGIAVLLQCTIIPCFAIPSISFRPTAAACKPFETRFGFDFI